jgi:hypothetical protein
MVGDRALTTRHLELDLVLEHRRAGNFSAGERASGVERLILQEMVFEENRLTGLPSPDSKRVQALLSDLQRQLGKAWPSNQGFRESEWIQAISKRLAVEDALLLRIQASRGNPQAGDVLRDWSDQLRTRYRVRMLEWEP